jgi:hypothetical protein
MIHYLNSLLYSSRLTLGKHCTYLDEPPQRPALQKYSAESVKEITHIYISNIYHMKIYITTNLMVFFDTNTVGKGSLLCHFHIYKKRGGQCTMGWIYKILIYYNFIGYQAMIAYPPSS